MYEFNLMYGFDLMLNGLEMTMLYRF